MIVLWILVAIFVVYIFFIRSESFSLFNRQLQVLGHLDLSCYRCGGGGDVKLDPSRNYGYQTYMSRNLDGSNMYNLSGQIAEARFGANYFDTIKQTKPDDVVQHYVWQYGDGTQIYGDKSAYGDGVRLADGSLTMITQDDDSPRPSNAMRVPNNYVATHFDEVKNRRAYTENGLSELAGIKPY